MKEQNMKEQNMKQQNMEEYIDLRGIISMSRKRVKLIVLLTLTCVLVTAIVNFYVLKPVYQAETSIIVGKPKVDSKTQTQTEYNDVMMYQKLVTTYSEIAKSIPVAEQASAALNNKYTSKEIRDAITVTNMQDTQILMISTLNGDPQEAANIVSAVSEAFIDVSKNAFPTGGDIQILNKAEFPTSAVKPNKLKNIAIAFFFGIFVSMGLIIIMVVRDDTIKTEEDIVECLDIPVIGTILKQENDEELKLITVADPKSPISEAFRTLRTNIQFSSFDKKVQVICVTSSGMGEGKSTTASNLAVVMAESGKKTLLIDCDQRKSSLHKIFGLSNAVGISNLLAGEVSFTAAVQKSGIDNLLVLTAGTKPPNPSELLSSSKMRGFIDSLRDKLDFVIIDTPPVLLVTDAQLLAGYTDGYLMVVSSEETERAAAAKAKELLVQVNAKILGAVINKRQTDGKSYYGHYYYGSDSKMHNNKIDKKRVNKKRAQNPFSV
jgi:polysaccharide biosynthesis transport protein